MAFIITNEKLVERRTRLGRYLTTASLIVILAPLFFTLPLLFAGRQDLPPNQLLLLYGALLIGLILSNLGGYLLQRWGTKTHERVASALKGLDKRYRLYNYLLPAPHVLLTPYGVVVLLIKNVDGEVYADHKGWRQSVSLLRLLRWFSAERLGDPGKDLAEQQAQMRALIQKNLGADFDPPLEGYIVFTNPYVRVEIHNVELPVVVLNEKEDALKDALRRPKSVPQISKTVYDKLCALFEQEADARREQAERGFTVFGRQLFRK